MVGKLSLGVIATCLCLTSVIADNNYVDLQFQKNNETNKCFINEKIESSTNKEDEMIKYLAQIFANKEAQLQMIDKYKWSQTHFGASFLDELHRLFDEQNITGYIIGDYSWHLVVFRDSVDFSVFKYSEQEIYLSDAWGYLKQADKEKFYPHIKYVSAFEKNGQKLNSFFTAPKLKDDNIDLYVDKLLLLHSFALANGAKYAILDNKCGSLDASASAMAVRLFKGIADQKKEFVQLSVALNLFPTKDDYALFVEFLHKDKNTMAVYQKMKEAYTKALKGAK